MGSSVVLTMRARSGVPGPAAVGQYSSRKAGSTVHRALEKLQAINLILDLIIAPAEEDGGKHGVVERRIGRRACHEAQAPKAPDVRPSKLRSTATSGPTRRNPRKVREAAEGHTARYWTPKVGSMERDTWRTKVLRTAHWAVLCFGKQTSRKTSSA